MTQGQGGAGRFGAEAQAASVAAQQAANTGVLHKTDVVVVGCPTDFRTRAVDLSLTENQIERVQLEFPITERLHRFFQAHGGQDAASKETAALFARDSGVPASIADRVVYLQRSEVKIVLHTVNKSVPILHGMLSQVLQGIPDLESKLARFGVHAILLCDAEKSYSVVPALVSQLNSVKLRQQLVEMPEEQRGQEVLNVPKLPHNVRAVSVGTRHSFLINNGLDLYYTPAVEEKGMTEVSFQAQVEALQAQGIATVGRTAEEVNEIYLDLMSGQDDTDDGDEGSADLTAEDAESTLLSFQLPRYCYKALAISLGLSVKKQQTTEDITHNIVARVIDEGIEFAALLENWIPMVEARSAPIEGIQTYLAAMLEEGSEEDEESEDGTEDADDSDEDDEDDDSDFEEEEDPAVATSKAVAHDDSDEDDEDESEFDDDTVFAEVGSDLTQAQRVERLEYAGIDTTDMNPVKIMRTYNSMHDEYLEHAQGEPEVVADDGDDGDDEEAEYSEDDNALLEAFAALPIETLRGLASALDIEVTDEDLFDEDDEDEEAKVLIENLVEHFDIIAAIRVAHQYGMQIVDPESEGVEAFYDIAGDEDEVSARLQDSEHHIIVSVLTQLADTETEMEDSDQDFIESESDSVLGSLLRIKSAGALVINLSLVGNEVFAQVEDELRDIDGVNYRFPMNTGGETGGALWEPADLLVSVLEEAQTTSALIERERFNSKDFARQLTANLNERVQSDLYEGRLEEGLDPDKFGLVVGDYEEAEEGDEEAAVIPMSALYNAHVLTRPVYDSNERTLLTTGLLNIAVPGFSAIGASGETEEDVYETAARFIEKAIAAVTTMIADKTELEVYIAFTLSQSSLLSDSATFGALSELRNAAGAQTFSYKDAEQFVSSPNVLEVAESLGRDDLPLTVLVGGLGLELFDLGGDMAVVVPCFTPDYLANEDESEDDESEDDDWNDSDDDTEEDDE